MERRTIKTGRGVFVGVSNFKNQPGSMLTIWDDGVILLRLPLDTSFPDKIRIEYWGGEPREVAYPGVGVHMVFQHALHIETDGEDLKVYCYEEI